MSLFYAPTEITRSYKKAAYILMFNHISEKVAENMVKNGTVVSEEKEIYLFGIQQGLIFLLNIGTTVGGGLLLGSLRKLIFFTTAYITLRKYTGGYHTSTPTLIEHSYSFDGEIC